MEYWQRNEDGARFNSEEDAYLDYLDKEDDIALEDYLRDLGYLSFGDLLHWAMGEQAFWEHFQDEITEARESLFEDAYSHWEDPDNEDDEDDWVDPIIKAKNREGLTHYAADKWGDLYEVNPTE